MREGARGRESERERDQGCKKEDERGERGSQRGGQRAGVIERCESKDERGGQIERERGPESKDGREREKE